jgi:small conductance mechanosensitive channel
VLDKALNFDKIIPLLTEKIVSWYEIAVKSIPNIIAAIVVFIIFLILAKVTRKASTRLLPRVTKNKAVIDLLRTINYVLVLTLGVFVSLEILNLDKTVTSILAGAGVLGLALGFAFQEIASNFVSGIFIAFKEPYKIGDIVKVDDFFGEITRITLRTTSITTFQGLEVLIPNKYMFTKPFTNLTTTPTRRVDIQVGVSYGDDLEKVEKVTLEALDDIENRVKDKEAEIYFESFGSSSVDLTARFWVYYPENGAYLKARHRAIINIKKAYDANDIVIPFPIRTLDFGIKGGKELSGEMLERSTETS